MCFQGPVEPMVRGWLPKWPSEGSSRMRKPKASAQTNQTSLYRQRYRALNNGIIGRRWGMIDDDAFYNVPDWL